MVSRFPHIGGVGKFAFLSIPHITTFAAITAVIALLSEGFLFAHITQFLRRNEIGLVNGTTAGRGTTIDAVFATLTLVGQGTAILTPFALRGGIPLGALHYAVLSTFKIEENILERNITWGWECPVVTEMIIVNILLTRFTKLFSAHVFLWRTLLNVQHSLTFRTPPPKRTLCRSRLPVLTSFRLLMAHKAIEATTRHVTHVTG